MKFPNLVLKNTCNCIISGYVYDEGLTIDGGPIKNEFYNISCNYQASAETILTDYKKIVDVTGKIYISGDPFPEISEISGGEVEVNGIIRRIKRGIKARNLDNTVNYTYLELK